LSKKVKQAVKQVMSSMIAVC